MSLMIESLLSIYIDAIAKLLKRLKIDIKPSGISISIKDTVSLDERIKKIEDARSNLLEGLKAIDDLKLEADKNKKEAESALQELEKLKKSKALLEEEVETTKKIIETDIDKFKEIAGFPSQSEIKRERIYGFISGIVASIVASGIIWGISLAIKIF